MGISRLMLGLIVLSSTLSAQQTPLPQPLTPRQISGQVRIGPRTAPQGVMVFLDLAPSRDVVPAGAGELERTETDSNGRFFFDHLERIGQNGGRELFAITVQYRGYKTSHQVVDLGFSPRAQVVIELIPEPVEESRGAPPPGRFLSAHQPSSSQAQDALAEGEELLMQKHDPKASVDKFRRVVKLDATYAPGYLLLGTAYMQLQDWQEAQTAFEKTTHLEPDNATALLGLGAALNQQQNFQGAQKPLARSLAINPNSVQAEYELARSLWGMHKYDEAEPHARRAVQIDKSFPLGHVLMGNIFWRRHENSSALTEFQEYLRLDPNGVAAPPVKAIIAKIEKELGRR